MTKKLLLSALSLLLLVFWFAGLDFASAARVVLPFALIAAFFSATPATLSEKAFVLFLSLYCALLLSAGLAQMHLGAQGIDFAIFSQVIHNTVHAGFPLSTLVAPTPVNFFTHHFSPIWYLPAVFVWIGFDARVGGLLVHTISIFAAMLIFRRFGEALRLSPGTSRLLTLLLMLHPSIRAGIFWEIREDIIALPFIAAGFLSVVTGHAWRAFFCWIPLLFCKETFFVLAPLFACAGFFVERLKTVASARTHVLPWVLFGGLGLVAAFLYWVVLPGWMFHSTFDAGARIEQLSVLLTATELEKRFVFLAKLFVPLGCAALLSIRALALSLPAAGLLGLGLITGLEAAHNAATYYAVLPTFCLALAGLYGIRDRFLGRELSLEVFLFFLCLALSFHGKFRPAEFLVRLVAAPVHMSPSVMAEVKKREVIVAGDYAAQFFVDHPVVYRGGYALIEPRIDCLVDVTSTAQRSISEAVVEKVRKSHRLDSTFQDSRLIAYCR